MEGIEKERENKNQRGSVEAERRRGEVLRVGGGEMDGMFYGHSPPPPVHRPNPRPPFPDRVPRLFLMLSSSEAEPAGRAVLRVRRGLS